MFTRKRWSVILSALLLIALLSGCTGSKSPKETLEDALTKSADIKTYNLKGSLKVGELNLPEAANEEDKQSMQAAIGLFKNAELTWTGAYRKDPMLMELNVQVAIKGDFAMSFNLPIVMNKDKLWVKIPNIPMLGLPAEIVGKYIEVDLKKLAEEQGQQMPTMDIATSQKLVNDVSSIVFKHIDEKQYMSDVSVKDSGITAPDLKKVVQVHINKDQVEPLLTTVVKDIAPEVIDLISKNESYRKLLNVKQEDLDQAKKDIAESKDTDIKEGLDEFKKTVKSMDIKSNVGIDKKGYASYTDATIGMEMEDEGQTGSGSITLSQELTDINGDVKMTGEPKAADVLTQEQMDQYGLSQFAG